MTHQAHPLPAYLSDLTFCLNGQTLKVHPPSEDQRLSHIGLSPSPTGDVGVFLSAEEERAEVRCSQALIRYNQGYETCFIAWDDANPVPGEGRLLRGLAPRPCAPRHRPHSEVGG